MSDINEHVNLDQPFNWSEMELYNSEMVFEIQISSTFPLPPGNFSLPKDLIFGDIESPYKSHGNYQKFFPN